MRFYMTYIEWETDGEDVDDLPDKLVVEVDDDFVIDNDDYVAVCEIVVNRASDDIGWLISDTEVHADERNPAAGFDAKAFNKWSRRHSEV